MILKPKEAEDQTSDIFTAKKIFAETQDAKKAFESISKHKYKTIEGRLLQGLKSSNENDYVTALESVSMSDLRNYWLLISFLIYTHRDISILFSDLIYCFNNCNHLINIPYLARFMYVMRILNCIKKYCLLHRFFPSVIFL